MGGRPAPAGAERQRAPESRPQRVDGAARRRRPAHQRLHRPADGGDRDRTRPGVAWLDPTRLRGRRAGRVHPRQRPPGRCPPAVRAAGTQPPRGPDVRRRDVGGDAPVRRSTGCHAAGSAGSARAWSPPPGSTGSREVDTDPSNWLPRHSPPCSSLALVVVAWRTGDDQISTADSLAPAPRVDHRPRRRRRARRRHRACVPIGRRAARPTTVSAAPPSGSDIAPDCSPGSRSGRVSSPRPNSSGRWPTRA